MDKDLYVLLASGFTISFDFDAITGRIRMTARGSVDGAPYKLVCLVHDEYLTRDGISYIFEQMLDSFMKAKEDNNGQV